MRILKPALVLIGICAALRLNAQDPPDLAIAKAIDQEILKLGDLPDDARAHAVKDLALRIRQQPDRYAAALASNLVVDGTYGSGRETLQEVATTLADALRRSPAGRSDDYAYRNLAKLSRYSHSEVSLDDPRYAAAMSKLQAEDRHRGEADFTLTDVQGQKWNLKSLRGKVVMVSFWAASCPPCLKEIPDLVALDKRFRDQGLVILSITDDEASVARPLLSQQGISYPVLLDPGDKVKELFLVDGTPESFVYDRGGSLAATAPGPVVMQGFLEMLALAGLR